MKQYIIKEVFRDKDNKDTWKEIKLGENDLLKIFEIYKGEKLEEKIDEIIKVDLPSDDKEALDILKNGYEFKGIKYVTLATTVGLMKKQSTEIDYSGEYFFIREDDKEFVSEFEDVVSLGKLKTKENTEMCINKDVVSRLSLAFSTGERVHIPGIKKAILPEMTYTYINNYLQFADKETIDEDGKKKKVIDLDNLQLAKHKDLEVKHTAMDGSGFIMPYLMDKIQKKLREKQEKENKPNKVNYPLSWIGIREIGIASKGLLVKFDFQQYLREEHGLDKLIVKDMWGNDVDLFKVDVIMNESQYKWAKWFDSMEEIEDLIAQEKYSKYRELFEGFNIVKYNKKEPKAYTESNYQIITNLALTPKELDELSKESEDVYSRVINKEVDATRIMLGDVARDENSVLSASTKIHKLLQLDSNLINLQSMKKVVESLVNKKVNNLAGGSLYLKGNYKVILKDAISYFDSLIKPQYIYDEEDKDKLVGIAGCMSDRGLQDNQNYVPKELGKRVLARCPLNSATELVKTELVSNELYDKYFGNLSSDICFYPFNDFMMRQSGADEDLDISFIIDENKIYNAVIDDIDENGTKWYFRNQFDGGSSEEIFTRDKMYSTIVNCRGNAIGELSNKGAIISNLIQEMPYKEASTGKINSYTRMLTKQDKEVLKKRIKDGLENGTILNYTNIQDEEIRSFIKTNFQDYKIYSYFTLYLQMVAIDYVKTGLPVKEDDKNVLGKITEGKRKPRYIYYAKYKTENKPVKFKSTSYSNTLLNNYCGRIIRTFGEKARESMDGDYNNDRLFELLKKENNAELNMDLFNQLTKLNDEYNDLREGVSVKNEIDVLEKSMKLIRRDAKNKLTRLTEDYKLGKYIKKEFFKKQDKVIDDRENELMPLRDKISPLYEKRSGEYNEIDLLISEKYSEIKERYSGKAILKALANVKNKTINEFGKYNKISSRFIIEFCFEEFKEHLLEIKNGNLEFYEVDKNGDIRYLYQYYKKFDTNKISNENLTEKELLRKKVKSGKLKKFGMRNLTYKKLTTNITIDGKKVFNEDGEILGEVVRKSDIEDGEFEVDKSNFTTKTNTEYEKAKSLTVYVIA
jgi:hypothetical protein